MKKVLVVIFMFFLFLNNSYASTSTAYEYILMDQKTGRILEGKNYHKKALIASITNIMTT